jgi:hypothetical protein
MAPSQWCWTFVIIFVFSPSSETPHQLWRDFASSIAATCCSTTSAATAATTAAATAINTTAADLSCTSTAYLSTIFCYISNYNISPTTAASS